MMNTFQGDLLNVLVLTAQVLDELINQLTSLARRRVDHILHPAVQKRRMEESWHVFSSSRSGMRTSESFGGTLGSCIDSILKRH